MRRERHLWVCTPNGGWHSCSREIVVTSVRGARGHGSAVRPPRGRTRRVALVVVAVLVAAGGLSMVGPDRALDNAQALRGTCEGGAGSFSDAGLLARACGHEVEWTGGRTPFQTYYALGDGSTRWQTSTMAVRAPRPDGTWVAIDTSIAHADADVDGRLEVSAPAYAMSFSDGSPDEPLARIEKDGHALEFDAPFDLTTAVVDGDQVTYPGVLGDDGLSLVVTVDPDGSGFRQVIQVDTPAAAANPALSTLTFPVTVSDGLELRQEGDDIVAVATGSGETVFTSPVPVAWDSSDPDAGAPVAGR